MDLIKSKVKAKSNIYCSFGAVYQSSAKRTRLVKIFTFVRIKK